MRGVQVTSKPAAQTTHRQQAASIAQITSHPLQQGKQALNLSGNPFTPLRQRRIGREQRLTERQQVDQRADG